MVACRPGIRPKALIESASICLLYSGVREIGAFLKRSSETGQVRGAIPKELEPDATAKSLPASLVAIKVPGRGVFAEDALRSIAGQAKKMVSK